MSMRERLPSIHIAVANPLRFLGGIAQIAETLTSLKIERSAGKESTVTLRLVEQSPYMNCSAHLIIDTSTKIYVAVGIAGEDFSYENYWAAAQAIINPLLAIYNLKEHTRHRMTVTPKEKLQPKLPPVSAKLFEYFTAPANKSNLSLSDWRRFYEFVRGCRANLSSADLKFLLIKDGFSAECACHIVDIYEHLLDFNRPRSGAEAYEYYHVVKGLRWPSSGS
jgi:hypothetical protein